jgi:protein-disulfide isomerase
VLVFLVGRPAVDGTAGLPSVEPSGSTPGCSISGCSLGSSIPDSTHSNPPSGNPIALVTPSAPSPESLADGRAIGRPDAPATLTIWEDFQCPACGAFTRQTEPRLYSDYVIPGTLRIVYRDFVFLGPESINAAVAARCAAEQGRFWTYHDYLFWNQGGAENQGAFDAAHLTAIAQATGLDPTKFSSCQAQTQVASDVQAETSAGVDAGIDTTPTLVIDDQVLPGAPISDLEYTALRNVIDASIAAHESARP